MEELKISKERQELHEKLMPVVIEKDLRKYLKLPRYRELAKRIIREYEESEPQCGNY